jgi:uncharacterized membrane protein YagU involved in acid resistance
MEFKNYLFLTIAAIFTTAFKILRGVNMSAKIIASKVIFSIIISVFFVPAIMDWFGLSLQVGLGLAALLTMISEQVVDIIEKTIPKKLNDKIDKL